MARRNDRVRSMPLRWMDIAQMINRGYIQAHGATFVNAVTGHPMPPRAARVVRAIVERGWAHIAPATGQVRYGALGAAALMLLPVGSLSGCMATALQDLAAGRITAAPPRTTEALARRRLIGRQGRRGPWQLTPAGRQAKRAVDVALDRQRRHHP